MILHLLSNPGNGLRDIVEASRPHLAEQAQPIAAYLPAASAGNNWLDYTEKAFQDLGRVALIDPETMPSEEVQAVLDRAGVLYIPGGFTFLLCHRLHEAGLVNRIRRAVRNGLPVVAFSAGTILCGPNVLTSDDMNINATGHFTGLDLVPFNFYAHYPSDEAARPARDDWIEGYFHYHTNPVLAIEDDAYLSATEEAVTLVRGRCWRFEKGRPRQAVEPGSIRP